MVTRDEILAIAEGVISGERNKDYGDAKDNFETIAALWSSYLDHDFTVEDVANMMTSLGLEFQNKTYLIMFIMI